jgi:hypothetical protein
MVVRHEGGMRERVNKHDKLRRQNKAWGHPKVALTLPKTRASFDSASAAEVVIMCRGCQHSEMVHGPQCVSLNCGCKRLVE